MKLFFKMTLVAMLISGTLVSGTAFLAESGLLQAEQLQGEADREFLASEGILEQIPEAMASTLLQGRNFEQPQPVVATDGAAGDAFGWSVALDGDTAVVGAVSAGVDGKVQQGAAYIFSRSGTTWSQQQRLVAGDGAAGDHFGISVALDGATAVVGANFADVGGSSEQGATYVFTRNGAIWSQQQKFVADDGAAGDWFGYSVRVDGDVIVVGAQLADVGGNSDQGAAYVFTRSGTTWSQQWKLVANGGAAEDRFGVSVALDGDTAVVSAFWADVGGNIDQGSAYIFTRSGAAWSQQQRLFADDGIADDHFGLRLAMDGDTVVVGDHWADVGGNSDQGAAYVFSRSGTIWSQQGKLLAGDGAAGDWFGRSVAVNGDTAVVGAQLADVSSNIDQGAAYVFIRSGGAWNQQQKLVAVAGAAGDFFGDYVALDRDTAVVGADGADVSSNSNQGRAYFFERQDNDVYLPTIFRNYCSGFRGLTEQENNDKAIQANGPLCFNQTYTGKPNSDLPGNEEDWFYVDWSGAGQIVVAVTNFPPGEFVVLYFDGSGGLEELSFDDDPDSNGNYHVEHSGKGSGRYFIRLLTEEESRPSTNYSLLVTTK